MTAVLLDHSRRSSAGLFETVLVALQGAGCAVFAGLFFWFGIEHPLMWLIIVPCLVVTAVAAYVVAWRMFGCEVVSVEEDTLRVELRLAGVRRTRTLLLTPTLESSVVPCGRAEMPNNAFGVGHAAVRVRSAGSELRCGLGLPEPRATELAERIRTAAEDLERRRTRG